MIAGTDSEMLETLESMLKNDYALLLTKSEQEALTQLDLFQPDVVFLQVMTAKDNAYGVCRQIKSHPTFSHVSVILISTETEPDKRASGYEAGADDILFYPFPRAELKTKLRLFFQLGKERKKRHLSEWSDEKLSDSTNSVLTCSKDELMHTHQRLKHEIKCRQESQAKLKKFEERFRNLVNQTRDGIFVAQANRFKYVNPRMVHLTGYSYKELIANPFTMPIHPDDRPKVHERHHRRMAGENIIRRYRFRLVTPSKKTKWVELRVASLVWWEGKPASLGFVSDLTEQLKIQEAAIQTEKMISVGGLAAGIAHEINNPLAGIMQSAQNIIRRLDPLMQTNLKVARETRLDLERMQSYLAERNILTMLKGIWHYGERASKVIQNMLHFVKKNDAHMKSADLNQLIDATIDLLINNEELQHKYRINFIEMQRILDKDLPNIPCLETEIQKVLINVLINAVQSVSENRLVRLPKILVKSKREKEMVCIEIEDNGSGINTMTQRRIFEPFFTTRPIGEGQGIGLSISYMVITHNHDGTMEVESDSEWGTRFIIRLPIKRPVFKHKDKNLINVLSDLH